MKLSLLIDGSLGKTQVGLMKNGVFSDFRISQSEVLEDMFDTVGEILEDNEVAFKSIDEYVYCEGPGSILGIRISCMAIRVWLSLFGNQKVLSYNSLDIASKIAGPGKTVYVNASRGKYFIKSVGVALRECGEEELQEQEEKIKLEDIYDLSSYRFAPEDYKEVEDIDAKLFKAIEYVKWDGERHRK